MWAASTCESDDCSASLRGIAGAGLVFFAAHTVALIPTLQHRGKIKADTQELINHITEILSALNEQYNPHSLHYLSAIKLNQQIISAYEQVLNLALPVSKKGDAVRNLFTIKIHIRNIAMRIANLLELLMDADTNQTIDLFDSENEFWEKDLKTILDVLQQHHHQNYIALDSTVREHSHREVYPT